MKPIGTGSFRIDDEHMKRKGDEDMKKKKAQEWVEKKKLYKHRIKLLWTEFFPAFLILGWSVSSGIAYLVNPFKFSGEKLLLISAFGPFCLFILIGVAWFVFSDMILPSFRNVKRNW